MRETEGIEGWSEDEGRWRADVMGYGLDWMVPVMGDDVDLSQTPLRGRERGGSFEAG